VEEVLIGIFAFGVLERVGGKVQLQRSEQLLVVE
jgi:hypothetical protein